MGNQTVKMPDDIPDPEVLATYSGSLKKAWDFRISGEKRVRKKGFGRGEEAMEEGCALFERAATQFKLAKEPDEAAKCYARVAECAKSVGDMMKAAGAYVSGGETMHQGHNVEGASDYYRLAIEIFKDEGKFDRAAKYSMAHAEILAKEAEFDTTRVEAALEAYTEAMDLYEMTSNSSVSLRKCREKHAMLLTSSAVSPEGDESKLADAATTFVNIGNGCMEKNITKFHAKNFFQKAVFCDIARGDMIAATEDMQQATMADPGFATSREGKLCSDLIASAKECDLDAFQSALGAYNEITPLDSWNMTLLLKAKRRYFGSSGNDDDLVGPGEPGGAGAGAGGDDDLL